MPDLHAHLANEKIEGHMFASQWFLTLYTAKFPLPVVFHILDLYLCEVCGVVYVISVCMHMHMFAHTKWMCVSTCVCVYIHACVHL